MLKRSLEDRVEELELRCDSIDTLIEILNVYIDDKIAELALAISESHTDHETRVLIKKDMQKALNVVLYDIKGIISEVRPNAGRR